MNFKQLTEAIRRKKSFLCVGLDTDLDKLPPVIRKSENPVFEFNKRIIDATAPFSIAFKPNIAFYESQGADGWQNLQRTAEYIRKNYPGIFLIADAKRGDIGNSSEKYAATFFEKYDFDAVTVSPYMGIDSVGPFLKYPGKWVIVLALTSNKGAEDFQFIRTGRSERLFETVLKTSSTWGDKENMMFVAGATRANMFVVVREYVPDHFLLVPGVGTQGGSLEDVFRYGRNAHCGLIVNASRSIIYADGSDKFDEAARQRAEEMQLLMADLLDKAGFLENC